MRLVSSIKHVCSFRFAGRLAQAGVMALLIVMALPAGAADSRSVTSRVAPVYPELAKRMRVTGVVKLEAEVTADGKVVDVKEVSGNHMLALAAKEALLRWKFAPGPADTNETVEISFNLAQ